MKVLFIEHILLVVASYQGLSVSLLSTAWKIFFSLTLSEELP